VDEELELVLGGVSALLFPRALAALGVGVYGLVPDGEDLCESFFTLSIWALTADIDLAAYRDGLSVISKRLRW